MPNLPVKKAVSPEPANNPETFPHWLTMVPPKNYNLSEKDLITPSKILCLKASYKKSTPPPKSIKILSSPIISTPSEKITIKCTKKPKNISPSSTSKRKISISWKTDSRLTKLAFRLLNKKLNKNSDKWKKSRKNNKRLKLREKLLIIS